jgi:hypothetical protein
MSQRPGERCVTIFVEASLAANSNRLVIQSSAAMARRMWRVGHPRKACSSGRGRGPGARPVAPQHTQSPPHRTWLPADRAAESSASTASQSRRASVEPSMDGNVFYFCLHSWQSRRASEQSLATCGTLINISAREPCLSLQFYCLYNRF